MTLSNDKDVVISDLENRSRCQELHLVLAASGIESIIAGDGNNWKLLVNHQQSYAAKSEIDAYLKERSASIPVRSIHNPFKAKTSFGIFAYLFILSTIMFWDNSDAFGLHWKSLGQVNSELVRDGALWRCFTALTLHQDAGHLAGNLLMGSLFGWIASQRFGSGVAWLCIVVAGGLGNFANATIRPNDHNSLGASTAVFAALGMVAMAERRLSPDPNTSRIRRWSPIISAILLFAWIGLGGPQTDVLAHLTGLGSGMILGGFIGAPPEKRRVRTPLQEVKYGVVAVLVIALCWVVAIAFQ